MIQVTENRLKAKLDIENLYTYNAIRRQTGAIIATDYFYAYLGISAGRTLDATDFLVNATSNSFTVTLPTAVAIDGRMYVIKNSGTGRITINTTSSETVDGMASGTLFLWQYESLTLLSNGANWIII